ncbi:unnamed protein product [Albugo candida]|uniref:Uncharacterized protein n=1 Tax=Albugo candida TaxID=65357 RepID=A0A024FUF4_9STRA|nr:unnamed protein product [Albugo candida]|eukprot:CCI10666.1 unnamed protein product [Albugo candida]
MAHLAIFFTKLVCEDTLQFICLRWWKCNFSSTFMWHSKHRFMYSETRQPAPSSKLAIRTLGGDFSSSEDILSCKVPSLNQLAECIETESNVYNSHTSKFSDADVHRTESTHVAASISSV